MPVRDAAELLYPAVQETLAALGLLKPGADSADAAAAKLCQEYARAIDAAVGAKRASVLWHLGGELHALLNDLGATPAGRAAMTRRTKTGQPGDDKPNRLHAIRSARGA